MLCRHDQKIEKDSQTAIQLRTYQPTDYASKRRRNSSNLLTILSQSKSNPFRPFCGPYWTTSITQTLKHMAFFGMCYSACESQITPRKSTAWPHSNKAISLALWPHNSTTITAQRYIQFESLLCNMRVCRYRNKQHISISIAIYRWYVRR